MRKMLFSKKCKIFTKIHKNAENQKKSLKRIEKIQKMCIFGNSEKCTKMHKNSLFIPPAIIG